MQEQQLIFARSVQSPSAVGPSHPRSQPDARSLTKTTKQKNERQDMKIDNSNILGELERLAEACPWDAVDLWICREPEGKFSFTAYVKDNQKFGFHSIFGHGATPQEAVDNALKQTKGRDPEIARVKKIEELKRHIEQLQSIVIGMPPYRPNRELCEINAPATVDV